MKICVRLSDPMLARALVDVLRAHGHEATHLAHGPTPCTLRVQSEAAGEGDEYPGATLVLRRSPDRLSAEDPAGALREALASGGTAIWRAPLDVGLLLAVLGPKEESGNGRPATADLVPDLSRAPHPWLVLDVARGCVVAANEEARMLLDLPAALTDVATADLRIGEGLRAMIQEESEGLRAGDVGGAASTVAWWTDAHGHRVVCLLDASNGQSQFARNRQSLAALGQMAATLAHEIRNPVASLAGALDLLETEEDPIDRAEVLEMARGRLKQLSRLLEKTLSLARPIGGPMERIDVEPVIASAVSTLTLDPRFQSLEVEVDARPGEVTVLGLEGPLLQALTNLLLNAAQATDGAGRVRIELSKDGHRGTIRIHDDGPGIPDERRQEIFKPFYTTKPDGTGLGLAEVRRAMEAVGGAVVIEHVETGACLRLEIPLAAD